MTDERSELELDAEVVLLTDHPAVADAYDRLILTARALSSAIAEYRRAAANLDDVMPPRPEGYGPFVSTDYIPDPGADDDFLEWELPTLLRNALRTT